MVYRTSLLKKIFNTCSTSFRKLLVTNFPTDVNKLNNNNKSNGPTVISTKALKSFSTKLQPNLASQLPQGKLRPFACLPVVPNYAALKAKHDIFALASHLFVYFRSGVISRALSCAKFQFRVTLFGDLSGALIRFLDNPSICPSITPRRTWLGGAKCRTWA